MTPKERRDLMKKNGIRMTDIAATAGVSLPTVSAVLDDRSTSDKVQRVVAAAINLPVDEVFPERYKNRPVDPKERDRALTRMALAAA